MAKIDEFMGVYESKLRENVQAAPAKYAYTLDSVPEVIRRMRVAIVRGTANYNSETFRATCKALGIRSTARAIQAFLREDEGNES